MPGPLWEATRSLHHACEEHVVGKAMASGNPPVEWYAKWLEALAVIHLIIDDDLPECIRRTSRLDADIKSLGVSVPRPRAATQYAISLVTDAERAGAAYVLTGAHLMGGEVMRRRLENFPTNHLVWDDRKAALVELNKFRERDDIAEEAIACFRALLSIMDEIAK